jgi:hypothetical protein
VLNVEPTYCALPSGIGLRTELSLRNLRLATTHGFLYERTDGQVPGIIFGRSDDGRHGNFTLCHTSEFAAIPGGQNVLRKFTLLPKEFGFAPTGNEKNSTA